MAAIRWRLGPPDTTQPEPMLPSGGEIQPLVRVSPPWGATGGMDTEAVVLPLWVRGGGTSARTPDSQA